MALAETNFTEDICVENDNVISLIKGENSRRFHDIIGNSEVMQNIFKMIEKVAECESTIIINGETGTGKGMVAKAIHETSARKNKPFIQINCGAIPENLLESELFGHVRGAFTGAATTKTGKFELANGGTIFLDEIGDMGAGLQLKILRVLEEKEFELLGGSKTKKVDVRIIAATHRNLEEEVKKGRFREDLYYRLYVIPIVMPPLRNRQSDIPLIIKHFFNSFKKKNKQDIAKISDEVMELFVSYSWPGNVRELRNTVERLVVLNGNGEISSNELPEKIKKCKNANMPFPRVEILKDGISLNTAVSEFEKALIVQSLEKTKWVKNKAAKLLQLKRTTLIEKIKRHQLQQKEMKQCPIF